MTGKHKTTESSELTKFFIEKTKNVTSPVIIYDLCKEFRKQSGAPQPAKHLKQRIKRYSSKIHEFSNIDRNTKVKLLFGLGAPLDYGFLKELQKHADVTLDSSRRIIEYKEKGGTLQLNGQHGNPICTSEQEKKMREFLAEEARQTSSPMFRLSFLKQFKKSTDAPETFSCLGNWYRNIKNEIFEFADFDMETKIRMLFVSGAELYDYVLKELRCDAHVEVDKHNRITKYEAKNGSLILEGDQNHSTVVTARMNSSRKRSMNNLSDSDDDDEDDESMENKKDEPTGSNSNTPKIDKKRKILASMVGSSSSTKSAEETESMNETVEDDEFSFDYTQPIEFHKRVKLEPFEGVLIDRTIDGDDDDIQLYFPDETEPLLIPKQECHSPYQIKFDRPNYLLFSSPTVNKANEVHAIELKNSRISSKGQDGNTSSSQQPLSTSNEKEEYTTQSKALEVIHNLIFGLNIPKLSDLQKKIEVNIEKVGTGDGFNISLNEIQMAIETCVYRVTKNATASPNEESTSLKEFLLVLRSVLFPFRFTLISSVQEKLVNTMEEIRDQDKRIPVEKVQSALQTALDIMDL